MAFITEIYRKMIQSVNISCSEITYNLKSVQISCSDYFINYSIRYTEKLEADANRAK